jgi:hypothetical protein
MAFYSTDKAMNNPSEVFVVDTRDGDSLSKSFLILSYVSDKS